MRAVVVGGSGQIGGWLLRVLAGRGHEAVGTFATTPFPGLAPLMQDPQEPAADLSRAAHDDRVHAQWNPRRRSVL